MLSSTNLRRRGGEEESVRYGEDGMPPPPPFSLVICATIPVSSPAFDLKAEKMGEPTEMTHFLPSLLSFRKLQIYTDSIFSPPAIPLARTVLSPTWRKLISYTLLPSLKNLEDLAHHILCKLGKALQCDRSLRYVHSLRVARCGTVLKSLRCFYGSWRSREKAKKGTAGTGYRLFRTLRRVVFITTTNVICLIP